MIQVSQLISFHLLQKQIYDIADYCTQKLLTFGNSGNI